MRYSRILSSVLALCACALPAAAQTPVPDGTKVASVIAIVGDSVITTAFLQDALNQRIAQMRADSLPLPTTEAQIREMQDQMLNDRIDELVILQYVSRDTTYKVNEDNLRAAVDEEVNRAQTGLGGPMQFAAALKQSGMTAQDFRTLTMNRIRTQELFTQFRNRMAEKRQAPKATEKDIEEYFPTWQARRGPRPAIVSFQQVVIRVTPSDTALARAKAKADSIFRIVTRDRNQFDDLARRFSDDPGSKDKGGEFGWFRENEVAKAFGRAAFNAPVGAIVGPVLSEFGYHVIEVERRRTGQVQARHILISPTITADDVARAQARADSAAARLRAGASMQDVVKQFGDTQEDLTVAGVDPAQVAQAKGLDLTKAAKGDLVGPAASPPGPGQVFTIARVTDTSPAGAWTLNDVGVRDNIRAIVEQQKLANEVVSELRRSTYIEIRPH